MKVTKHWIKKENSAFRKCSLLTHAVDFIAVCGFYPFVAVHGFYELVGES